MAKFGSKSLLFINIAANQIKSGVSNFITAVLHIASQTDIFDTLIPDNYTVANKTTLNNLDLGSDFKEGDFYYVTKDTDGTKALYAYLRDRITNNYSWIRINFKTANKIINPSEISLEDYIDHRTSYETLIIWDIVKIGIKLYLLKENTGSISGDYEQLNTSGGVRYTKDDIPARDLLSPELGDSCLVLEDGTGYKANYDWKYDNETSSNDWCCTGKWSDIT